MQHRTWIVGAVAALVVLIGMALVYPTFSSLEQSAADLVASAWAEEGAPLDVPKGQVEVARQNLQRLGVRGTVMEVSDSEVLVETAAGDSVTVFITDETRFWAPGEPVTTTINLQIGDPLLTIGKPATTDKDEKAFDARLLVVVSDEDLPRVMIQGRVLASTRQTLVVQAKRGERAITVLPRTHILSSSGRLESLRGVRNGDLVIALGQPTEVGQWMAGLVLVSAPNLQARPGLRGEVSHLDLAAGTLTVSTKQGDEVVVITSDETKYRIPEITEPGLADIQLGDRIDAVGRFDQDDRTRFQARGIRVLAAESNSGKP